MCGNNNRREQQQEGIMEGRETRLFQMLSLSVVLVVLSCVMPPGANAKVVTLRAGSMMKLELIPQEDVLKCSVLACEHDTVTNFFLEDIVLGGGACYFADSLRSRHTGEVQLILSQTPSPFSFSL